MGYLLLLQLGLIGVSRRRRWAALAGGALLGGLFWVAAWTAGPLVAGDGVWLGGFLLVSVAAFFVATHGLGNRLPRLELDGAAGWLAASAAAGSLLVFAFVVGAASFAPTETALFGLLAGACYLLAWREESSFALAPFAAAAVAALLAAWSFQLAPSDVSRFLGSSAALGGLLVVGAWAIHGRATRPAAWASLATASALAISALSYAGAARHRPDAPWSWAALGAAGLFLGFAVPIARRRTELPEAEASLAAFLVGVTSFVSASIPLELDRQWLTVAWAIEVPLLLALAGRLRVPTLRVLALLLAGGVTARLLLNPAILDYPAGTTPLLNWLLYGYGVPVVAFVLGARAAEASAEERIAAALRWAALALGVVLLVLEVRHFFRGGRLDGESISALFETAATAIVGTALGVALLFAARRRADGPRRLGGLGVTAGGVAVSVLGTTLALNPAWTPQSVGATPLLNHLLWIYGLPIALLALARRAAHERPVPQPLRVAAALAALLLAFVLVSLEVRQLFRGPRLDLGTLSGAEGLAYSAAWLAFGLGLLGVGVWRSGRPVRQAGLGVVLLAVLKVFLYDLSELAGLYRVLSFLGLGASLLLLAWLYQRFVFRERT
jgi:uncharacterized membrane protein